LAAGKRGRGRGGL